MANTLEYSINPNAYSCGIDHVVLPPEKLIGLHTQDTWELVYVISGSGIRTIGDITDTFHSGEILLIPPQMPHGWNVTPGGTDENGNIEDIALMFTDKMLRQCADTFPELREGLEKILNTRHALLMEGNLREKLSAILWQMVDESDASRTASLLRLFALIAQEKDNKIVGEHQKMTRTQSRINQLQIYINCNYNRNITLKDAAHHLGMNPSAFCVFLKNHTQKTFTAHLNEYRIHIACRLLTEKPDATIAEIAYQTGFNTICYFNRMFNRQTGMSPKAYRTRQKAEQA